METKKALSGKMITKRKRGIIRAKSDFFRSARYGLTLTEHRIIYYALLHGQQTGQPFEPVTITVKEFQELCDVKGRGYYQVLHSITQDLTAKTIEIRYKDEDGYHLTCIPWLIAITYHAKTTTVTIELNPKLKPFIDGKPFTETEFYFLLKFSSSYSERLYEILKSLSFKALVDFDITDLRQRLGLESSNLNKTAGKVKYPNYNDLKRYVLEPALRDINQYTDLDIFMREKRGRYNRVETVYFTVRKKKVPKLAKRIEDGEFSEELSEAEQEAFVQNLLNGKEPIEIEG